MFDQSVILITGGTGSFGKVLLKHLLMIDGIKKIIIYSRDEFKQFKLKAEFQNDLKKIKLKFIIGDIRDLDRLKSSMRGVDLVFHVAALKQVPAIENNPYEAIKTNIIGSKNVIDASIFEKVKNVVAISTDKAASPINLYGITKFAADKLFTFANSKQDETGVKFSVIRYGNFYSSRGSIVPYFKKEKDKGVLPITDKNMTRFFIKIENAVKFSIKAMEIMWGGEIFVPKNDCLKIVDLATAIAPNAILKDVGIRPGERIHEKLIDENDSNKTIEFNGYYVIVSPDFLWDFEKYRKESNPIEGKSCKKNFSLSSDYKNKHLSVAEIKKIIEEIS